MGVDGHSPAGRPMHPGVHVTADVDKMSQRVSGRLGALPVAYLGALVFAVALANRLVPVLRGAGLSGVISYDDGVYYAGAVGLVQVSCRTGTSCSFTLRGSWWPWRPWPPSVGGWVSRAGGKPLGSSGWRWAP